MSEANKNTIKTLGIMLASFGAFTAFALLVPDYAAIKHIVAYLLLGLLIFVSLFYTPLGNPIKNLFKKSK